MEFTIGDRVKLINSISNQMAEIIGFQEFNFYYNKNNERVLVVS